MLIAARNGFLAGGWKNPYVTDGLVAMWDGEWNAGGGKHDPNTTVWKDCVNGNVLTPIGAPVFLDRYVSLGGSSAFEATVSLAHVSTMEIVVSSWGVQNYTHPEILNIGGTVCQKIYADANADRIGFGIHGAWGASATTGSGIIGTTSYVIANATELYRNGAISKSQSFVTGQTETTEISVGTGVINSNRFMVGSVAAVRLYSRALTADEIAANYAVDKTRFNLPDA